MKINRIIVFFFAIMLLSYCQSNQEESTQTAPEPTKKVQALLLTQGFPYDNTDKNKISGPYKANQKLSVPQNLGPQNKWVMFEGPVLENDLIAYRFYMDSRHRTDIYAKRVNDMVMDTVSWQYHDIMDWGTDVLKVGASLGIGSPAIWYQDSLYTLSECDEKTVEITENSNDKANIRTTFKGLKIGEHSFDLIQDWSIQSGEASSEIQLEVVGASLPEGMVFATGIVKHLEDYVEETVNGSRFAYTWGTQSFHKEKLGMGIIMEESYQPEKIPNDLSHVYIFNNAPQKVNYRFIAAWERDIIGVKDANGFQDLITKACQNKQ